MKKLVIFLIFSIITITIVWWLYDNNIIPRGYYKASDFDIEVIKSNTDYDEDGIDDYSDILLGAKKEAINHSHYRSAYYEGGYPPDTEGVCTDVIWRALREAGYNLKDLIDEDIKNNIDQYPNIDKPDPNIDFRRVKNLIVYFNRNTLKLTNDPYDIATWMPGDIVIFGTNHIAIISDKRNKEGIAYIIHNAGQPNRDEDALIKWYKKEGITGHYRLK